MASIWQDINPLNPSSPLYLFPGPKLTKKQEKQGPTVTPGPNNILLTPKQQKTATDITNKIIPGMSFIQILGTLQFWKGFGLIVAGSLILLFAALEFKQMA